MSNSEIQVIRDKVGTRDNVKQIDITYVNLKQLQLYCIELLDYIAELKSEYVSPYNDPSAGWK